MATEAIPLTISDEAAAHVAKLGMELPFRQMLDQIHQMVPGLRSISVNLQEPYDLGGGPRVIFDAVMADPKVTRDRTEDDFERWQVETFPPEVLEHFVMLTVYG